MPKPMVAGNWKMHGSKKFCQQLLTELKSFQDDSVDIIVCPPTAYLSLVLQQLAGSNIKLGAQNIHEQPQGAFTGEISAAMLQDIGCEYVIIGHSERRLYFSESSSLTVEKCKAAFEKGITPILCVGESQQQRDADETFKVINQQLNCVLEALQQNWLESLVIAYEPVWAIGTGLTATPEQAQQVHQYIRKLVAEYTSNAADSRIVYGGSVKADNATELFAQPDINGGLIGGASLKAPDFIEICRQAAMA